MTRTPSPSARRRRPVTVLILSAVLSVLASTTLTTAAAAAAIDPWPHYQPQTTCSPKPKKGTLELARYLQAHYRGSGSYGISRACKSGGTSEHKEGRAFDWRVNVARPKERRYALDFLHRAFATDAAGHQDALARRMGIMYAIFNDKIYSATYHYRARPYKNSGCRTLKHCSLTLRHHDHMHISLTWAGARAQTSWYAGGSVHPAPPQPAPHHPAPHHTSPHHPQPHQPTPQLPVYLPSNRLVELAVPGTGRTLSTDMALRAGSTYKLTVFGVYRYGDANADVADAACVWSPNRADWLARPTPRIRDEHGSLQLLVNDRRIEAEDCRPRDHVYVTRYVPKATGPLRLRLDNTSGRGVDGGVHVVVSGIHGRARDRVPARVPQADPPAPQPAVVSDRNALEDFVTLDGTARSATSAQTLQAGVTYRITVAGLVALDEGTYTDGQCLYLDGRWEQSGSLDLATPGADHGKLYVNGKPFTGTAPAEDPTGCATHTHSMLYTPTSDSVATFALWDPYRRDDDRGTLDVTVSRTTPVPDGPGPVDGRASSYRTRAAADRTTVGADDADGSLTEVGYARGDTVRVLVFGSYTVNDRRTPADAACASTYSGWADQPETSTGQDLFALRVNGAPVKWRAMRYVRWHGWQPTAKDCSSDHAYETTVTVDRDGPLRLSVFDLEYRDNSGSVVAVTSLS